VSSDLRSKPIARFRGLTAYRELTDPVEQRRRVQPVTRTVAAVLLVVGGLGYADWVLQLFLPVQARMMTSFISELSAAGQPDHTMFRVADLAGGALLVIGGALAWLRTRRWPATWTALILLGLCIIVEASLPLDGTFTFAAILPKTGTPLWWDRVSDPHGLVSFVETLTFVVLFVSCTAALRRTSAPATWRRLLAAVGLGAVLCGVVDAALTAALLMSGHALALGLVQRIGVTLTALWLAVAPTWLLLVQVPEQGAARLRKLSIQ
jgi:hypothetical protein